VRGGHGDAGRRQHGVGLADVERGRAPFERRPQGLGDRRIVDVREVGGRGRSFRCQPTAVLVQSAEDGGSRFGEAERRDR
jgi:hypothetical protein